MILRGVHGVRGLGDATTDTSTSDSSLWSSITSAFQTIGTGYNTYEINQANIARAAQGLPLITAADVAPTVNVGVSPQIEQMLIVAAVAVGAILLLGKSGKRSRR